MIIPVVILSSSRHPDDIRRSYELHANTYIVKPADFNGFSLIEPRPPDNGNTGSR